MDILEKADLFNRGQKLVSYLNLFHWISFICFYKSVHPSTFLYDIWLYKLEMEWSFFILSKFFRDFVQIWKIMDALIFFFRFCDMWKDILYNRYIFCLFLFLFVAIWCIHCCKSYSAIICTACGILHYMYLHVYEL
jgi:hypothetical protein